MIEKTSVVIGTKIEVHDEPLNSHGIENINSELAPSLTTNSMGLNNRRMMQQGQDMIIK
jgi:hypothetical protein